MGVLTYTMAECTSSIPPARLFHALCIDNQNFLAKATPEFIKSIEFVHGDSTTVGCVKQLNFPEGRPFKYVKNRIDEIDTEKCYLKYTTIEGDVLRGNLESAVYEHIFEATGKGSHYKMIAHYHTKGDYVMKEEDVAAGKETTQKMFKSAEAYLLANPHLYA